MSNDDDRPLGVAPDEQLETVDVSEDLTVEGFDFDSWLEGVRPTRRAVRVFARADLVAQMEELAADYRDDLPAAEKRRIRDEVIGLRERFDASAAWFVVEARSAERIDQVRKAAAKRHGITLPADDATGDDALIARADFEVLEREILADAIVSPANVTYAALTKMAQAIPTEYAKLPVTMRQANSQLAQNAKVITWDFSPERSEKTGTAGSKRR